MHITPLEIQYYVSLTGNVPFQEWLESLNDKSAQYIVESRLARVERGLLGDNKWVAPGVFELRIDYGPGYRIYFGREKKKLVLLLCGGDKAGQKKDIVLALNYWLDYVSRGKNEKSN